jgi:spore coat polysaccharide biosynthesis predicted glycosyltransferase SpsG
MKILLNANGSSTIGLGHVFRCLTIANEIKTIVPKSELFFIGNIESTLKENLLNDFTCLDPSINKEQIIKLIKNADIFISDILNTPNDHISRIRTLNPLLKIICIDNNTHLKKINEADIVFNANLFNRINFINGDTKYYLGPKYMILRPDFRNKPPINFKNKTIFICFGGADDKGYTLNAIKAIKNLEINMDINIIVGPLFRHIDELNQLINNPNFHIFINPTNIIELMLKTSLAIVSAGIILYEVSALGIPSIVIPQVDHQSDIAEEFSKNRACINLGQNAEVRIISKNLTKLLSEEKLRKNISSNAKNFVDGKGLDRFIKIILEDSNV